MSARLGVNIDHIATLRQARGTIYPRPLEALDILKKVGADQVTIHLREDRRHIQDQDLIEIIQAKVLPVNMELALTAEMIGIAKKWRPNTCTFVPEKREEVTTEGGLDCRSLFKELAVVIPELKNLGIHVSLFLDPDLEMIEVAHQLKVEAIELHTGTYAEVFGTHREDEEFVRIQQAVERGKKYGIKMYAGHGLNLENLPRLVQLKDIQEYNIGHSIIARAVFVGLAEAIAEIKKILI